MRATLTLSVLAGCVLFGSACAPIDETDNGAIPSVPLPVAETVGAPVVANAEHVASCVEMVKLGAYTGDAVWTQVWSDAGESEAGVQTVCSGMGVTDPIRLEQIHTEWIDAQEQLAAADQAPPVEVSGPARYDTCAEARAADGGNYERGVHPQYDWYDDRDNDGIVCEEG